MSFLEKLVPPLHPLTSLDFPYNQLHNHQCRLPLQSLAVLISSTETLHNPIALLQRLVRLCRILMIPPLLTVLIYVLLRKMFFEHFCFRV